MNAIVIIPARGGSKGMPGKNLVPFAGRPLLAWSVIQARAAGIAEVLVSSDHDDILEAAANAGALPVRRPAELATDDAPSESALRHALDQWAQSHGQDPDVVVFLQATSPVREPEDITGAISRLEQEGADSLFSAAVLDDFTVWKREGGTYVGATFDPWRRGRRQDREPLYLENGSIYLFRPSVLRQTGNRLGGRIAIYEMPLWKSFEIDQPETLELCEYYFRRNLERKTAEWLSRISRIVVDTEKEG